MIQGGRGGKPDLTFKVGENGEGREGEITWYRCDSFNTFFARDVCIHDISSSYLNCAFFGSLNERECFSARSPKSPTLPLKSQWPAPKWGDFFKIVIRLITGCCESNI